MSAIAQPTTTEMEIQAFLSDLDPSAKVEPFEKALQAEINNVFGSDAPFLFYLNNQSGTDAYAFDERRGSLVPLSSYTFFRKVNGKTNVVSLNGIMLSFHMKSDMIQKFPAHPLKVPKIADMYVFTDATCGYCRHLEQDVQQYLDAGVQVHYVPWPRSGNKAGPDFKIWEHVMCNNKTAEQQAKAYYEFIMQGKQLPAAAEKAGSGQCVQTIVDGIALGRKIGVSGTPFIYIRTSDNKEIGIPGYQPVNDLLKRLKPATPVAPVNAAPVNAAEKKS